MSPINTASIATGGLRARDTCWVRCMPRLLCAIHHFVDLLQASGPLDAPEALPAGSCNSTDATNYLGAPVPSQTEVLRERDPLDEAITSYYNDRATGAYGRGTL